MTLHRRPHRSRLACAGLLVLATGLTACSGSDGSADGKAASPAASPATAVASPPAGVAALAAGTTFVVSPPKAPRPVVNATLTKLALLPGVTNAQSTGDRVRVEVAPTSTRAQRLAVLSLLAALGPVRRG